MTVPFDEQDNFDFTFKRDWETTEKTKNVSARETLKQNIEFWKNELKPSHFVENIINNVYVMPFTSTPSPLSTPITTSICITGYYKITTK